MPHIAIIASANGLGHTRRTLILSNELSARGHRVTLLATAGHVARMARAGLEAVHGVSLIDLDTQTSINNLRASPDLADRWMAGLPDLDPFDLVISDNLPEVLERRPDAVLSSHFLWHLSLDGVDTEYAVRCDTLLDRYRPRIIAADLLLDERLKMRGTCHPVGLFGWKRPLTPERRNLVISTGLGGEDTGEGRDFIGALTAGTPDPFRRIHVEPRLLPESPPSWLVPAQYDSDMYGASLAILCRPGAGTVTDGLLAGARLFCFYEAGNSEMTSNAAAIARHGVGMDCGDLRTAFDGARAFADSPCDQEQHNAAVAALQDGGHRQAADLIGSWVS